MSIKTQEMYAPIQKHIEAAGIQRSVDVAEGIADFILAAWQWIQSPPAPAAEIVIDRYTTDEASKYYRLVPR